MDQSRQLIRNETAAWQEIGNELIPAQQRAELFFERPVTHESLLSNIFGSLQRFFSS